MKTSLKDIAETLKLSKTTISWVLSGKGDEKGISLATQEKVFQCAEQLNFQPYLLDRSLNTGISGTIGFIIPRTTVRARHKDDGEIRLIGIINDRKIP